MCSIFKISVSAYKYYIKNGFRSYDNNLLNIVIKEHKIHKSYGYHRMTIHINKKYNLNIDRKTIYRYRKHLGITAIYKKKKYNIPNGMKISKVAPNIVNRNFKPKEKNRTWSVDITYVPHMDGTRSYLFAIKDLYDKSIVDYQLSGNMGIHFVIMCLQRAIKSNETSKLIIHSDQGVHFTCTEYIELLQNNNIKISHSRKGNCHDNSPIESFFAIYKKESLWIDKPYNYASAKRQLDEFMLYYNQQRIQVGLKGKTPSEFRMSA